MSPAAAAVSSNLPSELTSFVGRQRELAEAKRLLARTRLLTLTGPGGVGKTRLALRLAATEEQSYAGGAWLVELAALQDGALVPQAVAAAFGLVEEHSGALVQALINYLEPRRLLLVLDNCEHLLEASAQLAAALLKACPYLAVLTTSREPLNVPGEVAWLVPSLAAPRGGAMAQVRVSEAVQLFVERAAAARPSFVLTDQNGPAVARICQRLDGIALAIELAAVRTRGLPLEHIAAGLDDRFELLSGPSRGTVPRHVTLRALVDWSHELLSEPERGLFRRLAVFSGGWTVEAAVAVCGGEPADDVLRVLGALVEKSLVLLEDHDGQARYGFLETIRQYAAEKLRQSGELPALQRAHAEWFVRQTHAVHRDAAGPQVDIGFGRLAAEQDNLRAALDWCKAEDVVLGLELGGELMHFWYRFGYLTEGREHLAQLLAAPAGAAANQHPAPRREAATAAALLAAGRLAMRQGSREARDLLDRSLALARELNKPRLLASCLSYRGRLAYWQNELSEAKPLLEQALAVARAAGARQTILHALHGLGLAHQALGELATARAFYDEELALARVTEDPWTITIALHQRAMLAIDEEELTFAKKLLKEAIAVWRRSSDRVLSVRLLEGMAHVALLEGQPERAVRLSGAASLLGETFGDTGSETLRASFVERLAVVRNGLGAAASKAWQAGRTLTIEDALEEALADGERRPTPGGLTRRECEVARLLARGLSNREIGEALVVTEGTAKTHVEHILTKLGMSSRAEVAAWAAQHSLVEDAVGA